MTAHHRSAKDRALVWLMSVAVGLIALFAVGLVASMWLPPGPLARLTIRVVNAPRVAGDIHVAVDYCKRSNYPPAEVRWALLDGVAIMLPPYMVTLPVGCHVIAVSLPLNRSIAPGVYQLQVTGIYRLWPWREVVYSQRSPSFRLLPEEAK